MHSYLSISQLGLIMKEEGGKDEKEVSGMGAKCLRKISLVVARKQAQGRRS